MRTNLILLIGVAILAAVAIAGSLRKPDPDRPVFIVSPFAPGQSLAATGIEWTVLWGKHALTLDLSATREGISFAFPEAALVSICNDVLDKMPRAPERVQKADVYRVNYRRLGVTDANLPMKVTDGRCADWKSGTTLSPNYPPPLQDWELRSIQFDPEGEAEAMTFEFAALTGSGAVVADRTFADACEAVLTERALAGRNIPERLQGKIARIKLGKYLGPAILQLGTWQTHEFRVLSGKCVPAEEGSKT
jgi:hypothetical protein